MKDSLDAATWADMLMAERRSFCIIANGPPILGQKVEVKNGVEGTVEGKEKEGPREAVQKEGVEDSGQVESPGS